MQHLYGFHWMVCRKDFRIYPVKIPFKITTFNSLIHSFVAGKINIPVLFRDEEKIYSADAGTIFIAVIRQSKAESIC